MDAINTVLHSDANASRLARQKVNKAMDNLCMTLQADGRLAGWKTHAKPKDNKKLFSSNLTKARHRTHPFLQPVDEDQKGVRTSHAQSKETRCPTCTKHTTTLEK